MCCYGLSGKSCLRYFHALEELQIRVLTDGCIGHNTVGYVAMDYQGNLACGTSTGELQVRVLTDCCICHYTVGCYAMDYQGNLACGTSTVGITGKSVD